MGQLLNCPCLVYGGGLLISNGAFVVKICIYGYDSESFACFLVLITLNAKSQLKAPLERKRVTWQIGLIGGLAYGRLG